jgi:HlyD family secretion protein
LKLKLAVLAAILLAAAVWYRQSNDAEKSSPQLTLYGNVDIRQVSLAFNASERITELRVSEGDRVKKGDVLGVLDDRTLKLRLTQSAARIGAQEQALLRLRNGSRPEEIAEARAQVTAAEAEAALAGRLVTRLEASSRLTSGAAISEQALDDARTRQKVSLAQAERARKSAQLVIAGPRIEDIAQAERQLDEARRTGADPASA